MKPRQLFGLIVVLTALVGAYWLTLRTEQDRIDEAAEAKRVFDFDSEAVQRIRILRPGEKVIEAARTDEGQWQITKPHAIEAAQPAWNRMAAAISELKNERTIEAPEKVVYGLTDTAFAVAFDTESGESHRIAFGAADPLQKYRYASVDDGGVMLVPLSTFQEFDRELLGLRNRFLFGRGEGDITAVDFTRLKPADTRSGAKVAEEAAAVEQVTVSLRLGEDGKWYMESPVQALADQQAVNAMIEAVLYAAGENYNDTPVDLADYGLDPAGARMTVHFEDGESETVYFGNYSAESEEDRQMYVKRSGSDAVFTIEPAVAGTFPGTPMAFREYDLVTRSLDGLVAIMYADENETFRVEFDRETGWQLVNPVRPTDQRTVSTYISFLSELEAVSFPGDTMSSTGLEDPAFTVTLDYAGDAEDVTLKFGGPGPDADSRYALQDTGAVALITLSNFEALKTSLFNFRDKRLAKLKPDEVKELRLDFEGTAYQFVFDDKWLVQQPAGKVWERQSDMDLLLDALTGARASGEELQDAGAEYGLAEPLLDAQLVPGAEGTEPGAYRIGGVLPGNSALRYAQTLNSESVLYVPQQVVDDVRAALRGVVDAE